MNYIYGTPSPEVMFGTDAPDIIDGLGSSDAIHGGEGKDIYVINCEIKEFLVDFQDGCDLIDLRSMGIDSFEDLYLLYEYDTDIFQSYVSPVRIYLTPMGDPEARVGIDATDFIFTSTPTHSYTAGNDTASVTENVYSVHMGDGGIDTLDLRALANSASPQGATLIMENDAYGTGSFTVNGVLQHFFEFENVSGTHAADTIVASTADNALSGGNGDDTISANAGNDTVFGNGGNDSLDGGAGNDRVVGGMGEDVLTGGQGADRFVFHRGDPGVDQITDFEDGADRLVVRMLGCTGLGQLDITDNGDGSVTVAYDAANVSFTLAGTTAADLSASDFIFA